MTYDGWYNIICILGYCHLSLTILIAISIVLPISFFIFPDTSSKKYSDSGDSSWNESSSDKKSNDSGPGSGGSNNSGSDSYYYKLK